MVLRRFDLVFVKFMVLHQENQTTMLRLRVEKRWGDLLSISHWCYTFQTLLWDDVDIGSANPMTIDS